MPRIPFPDPRHLDARQREQYDRFPANLTLGLLLMEPRLSEALPSLANALRASSLDAKWREAVIVRVAALHQSAYELKQHAQEVKKTGWSDEDVAAIVNGEWRALPPHAAALLGFVDQAVAAGTVDDTTFTQVQAFLAAREIATVLLLIGHYMMVARFTAILQIEVDTEADNFTNEH